MSDVTRLLSDVGTNSYERRESSLNRYSYRRNMYYFSENKQQQTEGQTGDTG